MIRTEPISMAAAGTKLFLDDNPARPYSIEIAPGDFVAICFGVDARKPAAKFTHENLVARHERLHEFKHDRSGGGKYWTARPGVDLWFVFPKFAVTMLPVQGLSYVKCAIGGVNVTLNVSGGGGSGPGWTDWVGRHTHAAVGHPTRDLQRLAAVAVREPALEAELLTKVTEDAMDDRERNRFRGLIAASIVQPALIAKFRAGRKGLKIHLAEGSEADGSPIGSLEDITLCRTTVWRKPTVEERKAQPKVERFGRTEDTSRARSFIARFANGSLYRITPVRIDWLKTGEMNGLSVG